MSAREFIPILTRISVLLFGATLGGPALADPATLVSFSWSMAGDAQAAAGSSCPCQPPKPPFCDPTHSCNPASDLLAEGGSIMELINFSTSAQALCSAGCTCSATGAAAAGRADASPQVIDPISSPDVTVWSFGAGISTSVAAGAPAPGGCAEGTAGSSAHLEHSWEAVFDLSATHTRVRVDRTHAVSITGGGSSASSSMTLTGPGGTVHSQSLARTAEGNDDGSGNFEAVLPAGRYTFRIMSEADSAWGAPPDNTNVAATVAANVQLTITRYDCPMIDAHPADAAVCPPGGSHLFSVTAQGTDISYRWRRAGTDLSDGPTGTGSNIDGSTNPTLTISNTSPADEGDYDCRVTNVCSSALSDAATLSVGVNGDADADGDVDFGDVTSVLANFGASYSPATGPGDADGNGVVNFADVTAVLANFGEDCN